MSDIHTNPITKPRIFTIREETVLVYLDGVFVPAKVKLIGSRGGRIILFELPSKREIKVYL